MSVGADKGDSVLCRLYRPSGISLDKVTLHLPGLQSARTHGPLCETPEPSLPSQLPRNVETGPAMKFVEPRAIEKTGVLCSKSIEHVTMAAAKR